MITRRTLLSSAAATAAALALRSASAQDAASAQNLVSYGPPVNFTWERLQTWAEDLARAPYMPHVAAERDLLYRIDYDNYHQIHYRQQADLWPKGATYPVQLFHLGRYFMEPARIFVVEDSQSREVLYSKDLFDYGKAAFAQTLKDDTGFAGLRVMHGTGQADWIAFLGASYFRCIGETKQYGLSARGLAINTGMSEPEEFPRFTNFWIERMEGSKGITIYALLESPSATGAYRIRAIRDGEKVTGSITEVDAIVHARADAERLGIAPLTSMYWYGKNSRRLATDWRPEIHDSDGLAIWSGTGERIWRPLNNPPVVKLSSFVGASPKGFGLLQRERSFDAYEDDNVFYHLRPSVWVEPIGDWGDGAVQLLEIPTEDETRDNVVAFWNPQKPFRKGDRVALSYRIYWRNDMPFPDANAFVISTRRGVGGIPGGHERSASTKYVIDFSGGKLANLGNKDGVNLKVSASRGHCDQVAAYRLVDSNRWRAIFDFTPDGKETSDLRAYLEHNGEALSETWMYQHVPTPAGQGL